MLENLFLFILAIACIIIGPAIAGGVYWVGATFFEELGKSGSDRRGGTDWEWEDDGGFGE